MSANTYLHLPLETLYKLLLISVREMIDASESTKDDALIAFRTAKKQAEVLMLTIEERRAMEENEKAPL